MSSVKPLPLGLPPATSAKWHSRQWWDRLGYLRVRTLSNPRTRDPRHLLRLLRLELPEADDGLRPLYDTAVAAVLRLPRTAAGARDPEAAWDEVLTAVDAILVRLQQQHLDRVRAAGFSGKDVPPPQGDPPSSP